MTGNDVAHRQRIYYGALLAAILLFTAFEELYLRHWLVQHYGHTSILAGSLPNFLAAILLSLVVAIVKPPISRSDSLRPAVTAVSALVLYEIAQIWMPHRTFDWYDIAATLLGGLAVWPAILAVAKDANSA